MDLDTGSVLPEADVASEVTAAFEWSWVFANDAYVETVTCRVDNVKTRGVPVPDKLRGHVDVYDLKHAAASAAASLDMEMKGRLDHITCERSSTLHVACVPTCMVQWLIMRCRNNIDLAFVALCSRGPRLRRELARMSRVTFKRRV